MENSTNWDMYYISPAKTAAITRRITGRLLRRYIKMFANVDSIKSICELGGANSCFYAGIKEMCPGSRYTIIDNNERGLNLFRERFPREKRVVLLNDDILDRSFGIPGADLVFSVGLIEHFSPEDSFRAIRAHFCCGKPGGLVIIAFPSPTWLYRLARRLAEFVGLWRFHDERPLSIETVAREVEKYGEVLRASINWRVILTQGVVVARVKEIPLKG